MNINSEYESLLYKLKYTDIGAYICRSHSIKFEQQNLDIVSDGIVPLAVSISYALLLYI